MCDNKRENAPARCDDNPPKPNALIKTKGGQFQSFTLKVIVRAAVFIFLPVFALAGQAPKVDAGLALRVVFPTTTTATLKGSGSDASGGTVTFLWKQIGGNTAARIAQPTQAVTTISKLNPGLYTFTLTVTNTSGLSSVDTTTVSVLRKMTWTVEGITREALVHPSTGVPTGTKEPVIFVFHGHGGTDSGFAEKGFELFWPEAIVVYAQGLRTKTPVDTNCHESGWQESVGEVNCNNGIVDQDLKYFDAMLSTVVRKFGANPSFVFAHGWSNGCDFIYNALWPARRKKITALAPAGGNLDTIAGKRPIPVIHTAGTQDVRDTFSYQVQDVDSVRRLDRCSATGTVWATGPSGLVATKYASNINDPVVFLQYDGPHAYPFTVPPLIIRFFKEIAGVATTTNTTAAPLITKVPLSTPMSKSLFVKRAP